ncbi:MAG: dihydrodipicolinate synthase family protein [Bacillota bacterium]|nr:dihydrodipicolinate synthase family protein [Bacillota bacterium]
MNNPFQGIVVPAITPYRDDLSLDIEGVAAVLTYFDQNPYLNGLFITGATGEYDMLTPEERRQIIDLAIDLKLHKDWIPNTASLDYDQSLHLTQYAVSRGIRTVGVIFPETCKTFADAKAFIKQILSLGPNIFIYQTGNTPYPLSVAEMSELVSSGGVIGIKDSCSPKDFNRHISYITQLGDRITVIQGVEMLYLPSLSMGVRGVIGGGCNVYPQLFQQIRRAYENGENERAAQLQRQVNEMIDLIYQEGSGNESIKYYLSLCGVPIGTASRKTKAPLSAGKMAKMKTLHYQLLEKK